MVIDATRSPRPLWRRVATFLVLAAVIVGLALLIWTKELHHPLTKSTPKHPASIAVHLPQEARL